MLKEESFHNIFVLFFGIKGLDLGFNNSKVYINMNKKS